MKKTAVALAAALMVASSPVFAKPSCNVAWSHYVGWEPWGYIQQSGIMKKWSDKYGVDVKIQLIPDYMESINLYTSGTNCGVAITNMDALITPAFGGIDSTAIIIGDFSNGNDAIISKGLKDLTEVKTINLVQGSVSQYLLSRAAQVNGVPESQFKLVNTSDSDIQAVYETGKPGITVATWNPIVMNIKSKEVSNVLFDSSNIPGEIIDMLVVRTGTDPNITKALVGAWYEAMEIMADPQKRKDMIVFMSQSSGGTESEFVAQLKTTSMFVHPTDVARFAASKSLKDTNSYVMSFLYDHGLYPNGADKDFIGVEFPDGSVQGNAKNVKLRFKPQ